jgi:ribosomal protein S18 acetylase RimI-like enzyme
MIRPARPEDADEVADVFRRSFGSLTFLPTLHTPEEDRAYFRRAIAEQSLWVYEESSRVRALAGIKGAELTHLYVDPEFARRGMGSALLDHAKQQRPAGFRFWVFERNTGARRFYERHGCRLVKLTDGSGNEEREPDALYEWRPAT